MTPAAADGARADLNDYPCRAKRHGNKMPPFCPRPAAVRSGALASRDREKDKKNEKSGHRNSCGGSEIQQSPSRRKHSLYQLGTDVRQICQDRT